MDIKKVDDINIIYPPHTQELDNSEKLKSTIQQLLKAEPEMHIIINFINVEYINSSILSVIIEEMENIKNKENKIILSNVNKKILGLIKIVTLDDILEIYDVEEDAILSLKKPVATES